MAKKVYVGVDNVARKVKKMYIGVDGVARKIKKGYIGIGGVARPFFGGGLEYYGTITPLIEAVSYPAATHIGNYALFAGGLRRNSSTGSNESKATVTAYDTSLTRSAPTALSKAGASSKATHNQNYALFPIGKTVNAYNSALTRSTPTALSEARGASTHVGVYALFSGGSYSDDYGDIYLKEVEVYNASLTKSFTSSTLQHQKDSHAGAHVGNYALFAGGYNNGTYQNSVDAYNTSLTRKTAPTLSVRRRSLDGTTVGNYALFGGGGISGDYAQTAVDVYDSSLTKSTLSLHVAMNYVHATHVDKYALFHGYGGASNANLTEVSAFDTSLTRTVPTAMSTRHYHGAATHVGNYALFGGGYPNDSTATSVATVDAYVAN